MQRGSRPGGRDEYHHGNLREALIQAAMAMIAEKGLAGFAVAELARAVGVSAAAPYRHFRDRDAVVAEVARRGFQQLAANLEAARRGGPADPVLALERCAQAHLAFAASDAPVYAAMFAAVLPSADRGTVVEAREGAFRVVRRAAQEAVDRGTLPNPPPARMVALHVWALTHGIADLFVTPNGLGSGQLPMEPGELLEAGLLVYLRSLGLTS